MQIALPQRSAGRRITDCVCTTADFHDSKGLSNKRPCVPPGHFSGRVVIVTGANTGGL